LGLTHPTLKGKIDETLKLLAETAENHENKFVVAAILYSIRGRPYYEAKKNPQLCSP
jgi:hypothetical protein